MPTPEQKDNISAPVSQKNPNTGTTDNKPSTTPTNAPKVEATGTVKSPTGSTVKANESINKSTSINEPKLSPEEQKRLEAEKGAAKSAELQKTPEQKKAQTANEPFEKNFSSIKGEVLQGDSFRITLQRGNKTIKMPVPIEGSNNIIVLSNTFKLIEEMLNTATEKELDEKFHSFIE